MRPALITLALAAAGCFSQDPYSSAMEGTASCIVKDGKGTRCHEYTWSAPGDRTQLAATCTGLGSTFDDDGRCPDGAVAICVTGRASTHVYGDYTDLETFDHDCADSGGTVEEPGGCSATRASGAPLLLGLAWLLRRRRRR